MEIERNGNGDADAASSLMAENPDLTDQQSLKLDRNGNIVYIPPRLREERARVAAAEILKRTT